MTTCGWLDSFSSVCEYLYWLWESFVELLIPRLLAGYAAFHQFTSSGEYVADHHISTHSLDRLSELLAFNPIAFTKKLTILTVRDWGITVSFHPKPLQGDWNGAGCHTKSVPLKFIFATLLT